MSTLSVSNITGSPVVNASSVNVTGTVNASIINVTNTGTLATFTGSSTQYNGIAIRLSDASATNLRDMFFDIRNESGAAVSTFGSTVNTDGSSNWYWTVQNAGTRTDRRSEAMRLDGSGNLRFNSGYGSVGIAYGVRAWANWDGRSTGTITPRASGGVTSVTKITTGSYSINFNFTMPDVNYSVSGAVGNTAYSSGSVAALTVVISNMTTTYANVFTVSHGSNSIDFQYVNVSIVR